MAELKAGKKVKIIEDGEMYRFGTIEKVLPNTGRIIVKVTTHYFPEYREYWNSDLGTKLILMESRGC
jgi:hypothetical protein